MNNESYAALLDETLADGVLSRKEARRLRDYLADEAPDMADLKAMRSLVFDKAEAAVGKFEATAILHWVEGAIKALDDHSGQPLPKVDVLFAPDPAMKQGILDRITAAHQTIDVCVFNITEHEFSMALRDAHRRGVTIRVITDDKQVWEAKGNAASWLNDRGIPVKIDDNEQFMHNKFAIFDGLWLMSGSINWTTSGWERNHENLILTDDVRLVEPFQAEFEKMWGMFDRLYW